MPQDIVDQLGGTVNNYLGLSPHAQTYEDFRKIRAVQNIPELQKLPADRREKILGSLYDKHAVSIYKKYNLEPPTKQDFQKGIIAPKKVPDQFGDFGTVGTFYREATRTVAGGLASVTKFGDTAGAAGRATLKTLPDTNNFFDRLKDNYKKETEHESVLYHYLHNSETFNKKILDNTDISGTKFSFRELSQDFNKFTANVMATMPFFEGVGELASSKGPVAALARQNAGLNNFLNWLDSSKVSGYIAKKVATASEQYAAFRVTGSDNKDALSAAGLWTGVGIVGEPFLKAASKYLPKILGKLAPTGESLDKYATWHFYRGGAETHNEAFNKYVQIISDVHNQVAHESFQKPWNQLAPEERQKVAETVAAIKQEARQNSAGHNPVESAQYIKTQAAKEAAAYPEVSHIDQQIDALDKQLGVNTADKVAHDISGEAADSVDGKSPEQFAADVESKVMKTNETKGSMLTRILEATNTFVQQAKPGRVGSAFTDGPEFLEGLKKAIGTQLKFEDNNVFMLFLNAMRHNGHEFPKPINDSLDFHFDHAFPGKSKDDINNMSANLIEHLNQMLVTDKGVQVFRSSDFEGLGSKWQRVLGHETWLIQKYPEAAGNWQNIVKAMATINKALDERVAALNPNGVPSIESIMKLGLSKGQAEMHQAAIAQVRETELRLAKLKTYVRDMSSAGKPTTAGKQLGMSADSIIKADLERQKRAAKASKKETGRKTTKEKPLRSHDIEPQREIIKNADGTMTVKQGIDIERAKEMSLHGKYASLSPKKILIEMLQNSIDAIRDVAKEGKGKVWAADKHNAIVKSLTGDSARSVDGRNLMLHDDKVFMNSITLSDNGSGMTPEQLGTVFVDAYSSGKTGTDEASGGWGIAKATFQQGGDFFQVVTSVKEKTGMFTSGIKHYAMEGNPQQVQKGMKLVDITDEVNQKISAAQDAAKKGNPWPLRDISEQYGHHITEGTGTSVRVFTQNDTYDAMKHFENTAKHSDIDGINFTSVTSWGELQEVKKTPAELVKTVELPNATIHLSVGPLQQRESSSLHIGIANQGLYQYGSQNYLQGGSVSGLPESLRVNIIPKVRPGKDYPFTQDRERLEEGVQKVIDNFVEKEILERVRNAHLNQLTKMWDGIEASKIGGRAIHTWNEVGIQPEAIQNFYTSKALQPYHETVNEIMDLLNKKFVKLHNPEVTKRGFFFPNTEGGMTLGINIPDPKNPTKSQAVFLNPVGHLMLSEDIHGKAPATSAEQLAMAQWNTLVHEFAHNSERNHGVPFINRMAEMETQIPFSTKVRLIEDLISNINAGAKNGKPHDDFYKLVQEYERATRGGKGGKSSLGATGIDDSVVSGK